MNEEVLRARLQREKNRGAGQESNPSRSAPVTRIGRPLGTSLASARKQRAEERAQSPQDNSGFRLALALQKALGRQQKSHSSLAKKAVKKASKMVLRKIILWALIAIGPFIPLILIILLIIIVIVAYLSMPNLPSYRYEGSDTDSYGDYYYGV